MSGWPPGILRSFEPLGTQLVSSSWHGMPPSSLSLLKLARVYPIFKTCNAWWDLGGHPSIQFLLDSDIWSFTKETTRCNAKMHAVALKFFATWKVCGSHWWTDDAFLFWLSRTFLSMQQQQQKVHWMEEEEGRGVFSGKNVFDSIEPSFCFVLQGF